MHSGPPFELLPWATHMLGGGLISLTGTGPGGRGGITPSTLLFHLPSPISHCQAHSYLLQILKPLWLISSDYACCLLGANKLPTTKKMG